MIIKLDSDLCNSPTINGEHSFGTPKFSLFALPSVSSARLPYITARSKKVFLRDITIIVETRASNPRAGRR